MLKIKLKIMKGIFIAFDQAHREEVISGLNSCLQHGFTLFPEAWGRGTNGGEPHYGSHAWPGQNSAIFTVCPDDRVDAILERLSKIDKERPQLGLRAFVVPVEQVI